MGVSEAELPLRSSEAEKNAFFTLNYQNLVHIFCQHFTENPLFFSNEILAIIMSIQARRNEFKIGAAIQSKYLLYMKAERA